MHEIEALTEASIRLLDRAEGLDHRSLFKSLYDFEAAYDTGFTRFRVIDLLVKRRFSYPMDLEEHPDYEQYKVPLEAIRGKDFEHIRRDPSAKWHGEKNPSIGYWKAPHLYCEAGSEMWAKLVEMERFSGADREPPAVVDIVDVVASLMPIAVADGSSDRELAAWWYAFLPKAIFGELSSRRMISARSDPAVQMIRDTVLSAKIHEIEASWSDLRCPEREGDDFVSELGPDELPFVAWWFEPRWARSTRSE